ncbi:MAG: preprotein translocase subunit YajC [Oscillospiraceae bacterium]|nr:preprotein translocase subunit YajC [Oscillospiraceae bacterium]
MEATASANTAATEEVGMGVLLLQLLPMVILVVFMYLLMIRPQKKKEKEQKEMRDNLQIGDEVTTIGGITGIIVRKGEDTVVIETGGDRSKIRVKTWAISENLTIHDMPEESAKK